MDFGWGYCKVFSYVPGPGTLCKTNQHEEKHVHCIEIGSHTLNASLVCNKMAVHCAAKVDASCHVDPPSGHVTGSWGLHSAA